MNKNIRKKSLYLVINMAFADMIFGVTLLSVSMHSFGLILQLWGTSSFIYPVRVIQLVVTVATLLFAVMISSERFYAVYWPLKHRTLSMRAYRIVIIVVWTLAVLVPLVPVLSRLETSAFLFVMSLCTLCLLFIVCGLNIGIWRNFHHGTISSHQQNRASQNQRLTKTLLFVSIVTLASWLPIIIYNVYSRVCKPRIPINISHMVFFFFYFNSFVNPLVYGLRIPEFKRTLGLCCSRRQKVMNRGGDRAVALTPVIQLRTLPTDPSFLQLASTQEIRDTKL